MDDEGLEDAAIFLMSLGEEQAAEVFRHLGPKEVQRLGETIAKLKVVPRERVDTVLTRFTADAGDQSMLVADTNEYVKSVLRKALGDDKANLLIDRILQGSDVSGIESLKWMDPSSAADLIRNEHPQIISTILVHLEPDQSSAIMQHFSERLRNDVLLRIATLEGVQPQAIRELNDVLTQLLSGSDRVKKSAIGGVQMTAEILNFMGSSYEASALGSIREYDPELAQRIQDKMFVFENLCDLDNRSIQVILREISPESLITALKGTSQELKDKIFKNMSSRAAEMLKDDFEAKGPVKVSEVEAEQKEILKIVRKLADDGQIVLTGKSGEEGVVE